MDEFDHSEMYILPGDEMKMGELKPDEIDVPVDLEKEKDENNKHEPIIDVFVEKYFACYVCSEILPWSQVSLRTMRPFQEGQTYICEKCDCKNSTTGTKIKNRKDENVDDERLQAAIIESVASHGIDLKSTVALNIGQFNSAVTKEIEDKRKEERMETLGEEMDQEYAKRPYECSLCEKRFKRNGHLQRHLRTHSDEGPIFECDQCDKSYRDSFNLYRHKKLHENDLAYNDKPYTCGICEKKFRDNYDLQRHLRIHTGEQPFKCYICDQGFIDNRALKKHIKQHKGEKHCICPICKKGFFDNRALNRHIRTYNGAVHYKCDICNKTFYNRNDVDFHLKVHDECPLYKCEFCGEGFRSGINFQIHSKVHEDEMTCVVLKK